MNNNSVAIHIYDLSPEEIRAKVETRSNGSHYMVIGLDLKTTIFLGDEKTAKGIANELVRKLLLAIQKWEGVDFTKTPIEQPELLENKDGD